MNVPAAFNDITRGDHRHWIEMYPYAARYLAQTLFPGPLAHLRIPYNWSVDSLKRWDDISSEATSKTISAASSMRSPVIYYWEVTMGEKVYNNASQVGVGLQVEFMRRRGIHFDKEFVTRIQYWGNGAVMANGELAHQVASYRSGDVLGCGFTSPQTFFFTKNGKFLGSIRVATISEWNGAAFQRPKNIQNHYVLTPLVVAYSLPSRPGPEVRPNWGQSPFLYDIEGHCARLHPQLPRKILEFILLDTIAVCRRQWAEDRPSYVRNYRADVAKLASVCRDWYEITRQSGNLDIVSRRDLVHAISNLPTATLGAVQALHCYNALFELSLSPLPRRLPWLVELISNGSHEDPCAYFPPRLSSNPLFKSGFSHIRHLFLGMCQFRNWIRFAQFVFAFPQLETFKAIGSGIVWEDVGQPYSPPSWLRRWPSLRRIGVSYPCQTYWRVPCQLYRFLWLLVVGVPRRTSTSGPDTHRGHPRSQHYRVVLPHITGIVRLLPSIATNLQHFETETNQDGGYKVVCLDRWCQERVRCEFAFMPEWGCHMLVHVWIHLGYCRTWPNYLEKHLRALDTLIARLDALSHHPLPSCSVCIDMKDMQATADRVTRAMPYLSSVALLCVKNAVTDGPAMADRDGGLEAAVGDIGTESVGGGFGLGGPDDTEEARREVEMNRLHEEQEQEHYDVLLGLFPPETQERVRFSQEELDGLYVV